MRAQISRVYAHFGEHDAAIDLLDELHASEHELTVKPASSAHAL